MKPRRLRFTLVIGITVVGLSFGLARRLDRQGSEPNFAFNPSTPKATDRQAPTWATTPGQDQRPSTPSPTPMPLRLDPKSCPDELRPGLEAIRSEFPHRFGTQERLRLVRFQKLGETASQSLDVEKQGLVIVRYARPIDAFRALGRLLGESGAAVSEPFQEKALFETLGVHVDLSRNAVLTPAEMKSLLCRLALMGINTVLPYFEETFELPSEPFFGYLRGAYTLDEMKDIDDFAFSLGIEMFPCMETLGHLEQVLQWPRFADYRDTEYVLIADEERSHALVERMIRAAAAPFRSRRIHVGLDEASDLGRGRYRLRHGEKPESEIFLDHLQRVRDICVKAGLQPMMWGDMFFRLGSREHKYYDPDSSLPPGLAARIPKDMQIVYWDFYHLDPGHYTEWIKRHQKAGITPIVDGALWTWMRFWAALPYAMRVTDALMVTSKDLGMREALIGLWFDDGAECEISSALPGIQFFAEHGYHQKVDQKLLRANFYGSTNTVFDDWLKASEVDVAPGLADPEQGPINIAKPLLWQDPLLAIFDPQMETVSLRTHYRALGDYLEKASGRTPNSGRLRFPALLAKALSYKCDLRRDLVAAYAARDKGKLRSLARPGAPQGSRRRAVALSPSPLAENEEALRVGGPGPSLRWPARPFGHLIPAPRQLHGWLRVVGS